MLRQTKKDFKYTKEFATIYAQYGEFEQIYKFFIDNFVKIHGEPTGNLVDLCCGTGDILKGFKYNFPNLDVVGYDESSEMLSAINSSDIMFVNKPITLIDKVFDNIISNNAYHHFDNIDDFWKVVNCIAHQNSKILISDVIRPEYETDVPQVVKDVLGPDSIFETAFTLSLTSAYTETELKTHIGLLNLIIIDTPIDNYKLFFIHN
jgi:ubiquinone/menaquinone biosynthesis C-methylase UbiE